MGTGRAPIPGIPDARAYPFELAREPIAFFGPVSDDFAVGRLKRWSEYHPDVRRALTGRGMTPAASETSTPALKSLMPPQRGRTVNEHAVVRRKDGSPGFYVVDLPVPDSGLGPRPESFDRATACGLDHAFAFSGQPGFRKALASDHGKSLDYYAQNPLHAQRMFTLLWANRSDDPKRSGHDFALRDQMRMSWGWVAENTPSARTGFALSADSINKPDRANRTPLETMLFPVVPAGSAAATGLSRHEFATMLRAGANPYYINRQTDRSVVDTLIAARDNARLFVVIGETARPATKLAQYVTANTRHMLQRHVASEFPAPQRATALAAIRTFPDPPPTAFAALFARPAQRPSPRL